jgi:hypothetical protein
MNKVKLFEIISFSINIIYLFFYIFSYVVMGSYSLPFDSMVYLNRIFWNYFEWQLFLFLPFSIILATVPAVIKRKKPLKEKKLIITSLIIGAIPILHMLVIQYEISRH